MTGRNILYRGGVCLLYKGVVLYYTGGGFIYILYRGEGGVYLLYRGGGVLFYTKEGVCLYFTGEL